MQAGDCHIKTKALVIGGYGSQRLVRLAQAGGRCGAFRLVPAGRSVGDGGTGLDGAPDALDEAVGALDAGVGPFHVALGRAVGEHEPARRVGAVGRR